MNAYTWLTKNVGHVSGDNLQSYQDTINDAIRNAGGREILRIFEAVKLQGLLGGSTVTNFFNPTCFNKININIERLENEKTLNDASLTRMLTRVKKLVELGEFGNIALTTEDLEWHQVTCTDESRCLTHLDERISNASTSLIQRINDLITRAGSVERQNYLDSVEFDRDIDGIHLFRLPELEDTSGYLLTEIAKVFKTGDNCQLNTGVADSTSMCLYTDALVDPKLKQAYASQYVHEKTMVKLETGTGASLSSVLYEGDPWSASEDGSIIQFDPCAGYIQGNNPGYVVEKSRKKHWGTCAITQEITCTDFWTGNLLSGACWGSAETRANWASTEERSYPVNHECFLLTNEPPPREDSGVTMSTGAQDDRVARFTYVHISEGVTFSVSHAPSEVLLEANTDLSYVGLSAVPVTILRENAFALVNAVLPFVKIPDTDSEVKQGRRFKNSWSLKGVIFQSILTLRSLGLTSDPFLSMVILMTATLPPNILPVLPDAWLALLGKSSRLVGTIYAHVPRYLSDYYESVPRITDDVEILHLYDCDSIKGVASVRGMDVPTTGSVFRSKSSFEPLPEIRFKITSRDRNLAVEQKSKQPVSRLAFAQFHHHQIPEAFFDPAYPSALHTKSNSVYASLGNLRHLIQSKLTSSAADALECHGCVQVKRKEYARYASKEPPKNSNPFGSVPGGYHTSDWHGLNRVRTLQDIIDQVDINNKDQPWVLMGKTYSQFYEEVKTALPVFWISLYDIISPDTYDFAKLKTVIREGNDIPFLYNLNEKTNTVEVDLGYFMGSWVLQHFAEAKLVYIANNWPTLSSKWFEVYNRPRPITRGPWLGGPGGSTQAIENAGVVGYTIGLEQGLYCHDEKAKDVNCGPLKLGVKKTLNTKKCFECTYISEKLCTGQNKCGARPWLRSYMGDDFKNWIKVGPKTETLQTIIDGTWMSPAKHVEITWAVLRTGIINDPVLNIVESIRDSRNNNLWTKPRISVPFVIGDKNAPLFDGLFEKFPLTWDSWGAYNPEGAIKYEETTGIIDPVTKIPAPGACIDDDTPETNFVDYTECDMNSGIEFLARHTVENFSHKRGVCIPTGSRASWEITRDQMTGTGAVPFWANANRESRDRFVSWIVDHKEHCRNHHGDRTQSVCFQDQSSEIHLFNPWLGGDFSPIDKCDYTYQSDKFSNVIDTMCADGVCDSFDAKGDQSIFAKEQYTPASGGESCWRRDGQIPTNIVVGFAQRNNLCSKTLRTNTTCTHPQGTLAGPGKPAQSVYTTFEASECISMRTTSSDGATVDALGGFLVQPRHTAFTGQGYSTSSGDKNGGALRVSPYDIAGHHIRYMVSENGITVGDVMLRSYTSLDEAELQEGVGTSWFHEFDTLSENNKVTPELQWKTAWSDWACPLRQQTFLQGGNSDFKPKKPDQRRARVLFSQTNNNLFVHPTQKEGEGTAPASSPYYTGNGVCACATPDQCQFDLSDTSVCGFLDTLKSLHDNDWR